MTDLTWDDYQCEGVGNWYSEYRCKHCGKVFVIADDAVAYRAEVERLRAALRVIEARTHGSSHHMGAYIAEVARDALSPGTTQEGT
jgi:hypothetical protein